jgi:hypothetical protein
MSGVWLSITAGFVAYRTSDFFVWNDSPSVMIRAEEGGWADVFEHVQALRQNLSNAPFDFIYRANRGAFDKGQNCSQGGGYRPLSALQTTFSQLLMTDGSPTWWHLAIWGSAYATFALCCYFVAKRFVRFRATAALAVLLLICSPPCVAASWVVVAGFQILVPLWICASLLLYWHAVEGTAGRGCATAALCVMMLLGPWLREFIGIVPLLVGCLELSRARRPTPLLGIAVVFFAHAVYPTALLALLFFPDLPMLPVSQLGNLGSQMSSTGVRWFAGWHFIPLFPPTLLVLAGISAFFNRQPQHASHRFSWQWFLQNGQRLVPYLWLAGLAFCLMKAHPVVPVVLCLMVAVVGLQLDAFLCLWFLLSFVPILRVFTEHVHFLYALVPASIILAAALERIWIMACEFEPARSGRHFALARRARWAIPVLGAIFAADQALTLYGSWVVVHAQYAGIKRVAAHLRQNVPPGSAVVGNVVHLDEIKWLTNSYFQAYYSIGAGIVSPQREVDPDQLQVLLKEREARPVYFLDCDFEYLPAKINYHRHKYVHRSRVAKTDLGIIHVSRARYPFLDPVRHLVKWEHVPFLGPPDLENDFYRGPDRDTSAFSLETYAIYRLYKVDGETVETYSPASIQLVEQMQEFNILTDGKNWMAIPQRDGAFDLSRLIQCGYSRQFTGETIDAVREQIADHVEREAALLDARRDRR